MTDFTIHTKDAVEGDQRAVREKTEKRYGFVPNLLGGLAENPATVDAYLALGDAVGNSGFTPTERHVAWFAANYYHDCHYCMPAHTAIAHAEKIADDVIEAARTGAAYADPKLQALRVFTVAMLEKRGAVSEADLAAFLAAGFENRHVIGVITVIAHKTISNYANHVMRTPVDEPFRKFDWTHPGTAQAA